VDVDASFIRSNHNVAAYSGESGIFRNSAQRSLYANRADEPNRFGSDIADGRKIRPRLLGAAGTASNATVKECAATGR
jgi:hypothetical protein